MQRENASRHDDDNWLLPLLAEKWFVQVFRQLSRGAKRYGELFRGIPGISMLMLSFTLKHMERDGLVE